MFDVYLLIFPFYLFKFVRKRERVIIDFISLVINANYSYLFLTGACLFRMFSAVFWNKFIPACDLSYWSTWTFFQIIFLLLFSIAFGVFRWKLFYVLEEQTLRFTVSIFWLHRFHKIWTTPCLFNNSCFNKAIPSIKNLPWPSFWDY